jgi:hypothetical protein
MFALTLYKWLQSVGFGMIDVTNPLPCVHAGLLSMNIAIS